jgi:hypothetical protein
MMKRTHGNKSTLSSPEFPTPEKIYRNTLPGIILLIGIGVVGLIKSGAYFFLITGIYFLIGAVFLAEYTRRKSKH